MKKKLITSLVCISAQLTFCLPPAAADNGVRRVLFIGNSFTFANDMPEMFGAVAESLGVKVSVEQAAPGGYTLQQHAADKRTLAKIRAEKWAFVVLQEQSQRPQWPEELIAELVLPYARQIDSLIHENNDSVKTVYFETWAYESGDTDNCASLRQTCGYDAMQDRLISTYARLLRQTGGLLAPVGQAWRKVKTAQPGIRLYGPDGRHPSRQGSYLAACVLFSAMFHRGVFGADRLDLPAPEAAILQKTAQEAVFHPVHGAHEKERL
ncbi:MAG: hypothetical protein PHW69_07845 [Elusimicrobiaceae bacterium]|nr:hypothetical protein [Elusimicrobiaceae bacterium]